MRVLVVDDHEVIRRGVRSLLLSQSKWDVCGEAVDGQDALAKARELKPDVIVMDISMPNLNGLEATRLIRNTVPNSEVVILSQHESPEMVRQAFKAGARGYVVKSSISRDLLTALSNVSQHQTFVNQPPPSDLRPSVHLDAQEILQRSAALEQALRESEALYRSTFNLAAAGLAHVSPDGRWLLVNDKLCQILGYTEDELLKMRFQQILHPEDLPGVTAELEEVRSAVAHTLSVESRYIRKDGSPIWGSLRISAVRDSRQGLKHFIAIIEDISERREAEQTRARLAAIVDTSDDVIVSKDLNGIIKSWNAGAQRIFEFTAEEAVGKPITLIIPPELQSEEKEILRRLRKGERIDHFETIRMTKSGKRLNISLTVSPIKDAKGRIVGASKVARDVTERRTMEQQLNLALEASKTAIFEWDILSRRGAWNPQMESIYGFTPAGNEITADEWYRLFHPDDARRLVSEAEQVYRDKKEFHFEFRAIRPDGALRWISSRGRIVRDVEGKAVRMLGTHTDVTHQKQAEEALRQSDALLRAAFRQTYSFLVLLSADGTIMEANRAALDAAGCEREQIIGRKMWEPWWSALPSEISILQNRIAKAARGELVREECFYHLHDGTRRFAHRTLTPVLDERGNVQMIVAAALDLTEQKQLQDQLEARVRERTLELELKNRALIDQAQKVRELSGRLLRVQDEERRRVARELHDSAGQMLAALHMTLAPLSKQSENMSERVAHAIAQSVELVDQLSKELRTVSYLLHPPLLDEAGLPSAIRWYVEGFAERSHIDVHLTLSPDLGRLPKEMEIAIFRIVQECLTNIHRHSGSEHARVSLNRSADAVNLLIEDQGKGMPQNGGSSEMRSGVGIQGMRERVTQLGGDFSIHSNEKGTTVTVNFPLGPSRPSENSASVQPANRNN